MDARGGENGGGTPDAVRREFASDPTNIEAAARYWRALATRRGGDARRGRSVIEIFRSVLISNDGVIALVNAYKELFEISGEAPRASYFDESLLQALRKCQRQATKSDHSTIEWVLSFVESKL